MSGNEFHFRMVRCKNSENLIGKGLPDFFDAFKVKDYSLELLEARHQPLRLLSGYELFSLISGQLYPKNSYHSLFPLLA